MRLMLEDSILIKDKVCTAGSAILGGFRAPFSATVVERCLAAGFELTGQTVPDEFGIDTLFDPSDQTAASVAALTEGRCDAVLCNDLFGKLRRQAPGSGLAYLQPAYGTVSRYGLIPSVSSMDRIGVLCRRVEDGAKVLSAISGHDERDGTSLPAPTVRYDLAPLSAPLRVGVSAALGLSLPPEKAETAPVELQYWGILPEVFTILSAAEINANTNRYDGVKAGLRAEDATNIGDLYVKTRSQGLGREAKTLSLMGCMVLSQEHYETLYHKSMQIRRLVRDYYAELLAGVDAVALPVRLEDGDKFRQTALYALTALCGFPSVTFGVGEAAVQLIAAPGRENAVFSFGMEVAR